MILINNYVVTMSRFVELADALRLKSLMIKLSSKYSRDFVWNVFSDFWSHSIPPDLTLEDLDVPDDPYL